MTTSELKAKIITAIHRSESAEFREQANKLSRELFALTGETYVAGRFIVAARCVAKETIPL